jgi:anti-sigma B factor antagonist
VFVDERRSTAVRIELVADDGVVFLNVSGELDLASADSFRRAGLQALTDFTGTLRINLANVTFIDSTGVGALIAIRNAADRDRHTLILEQPSPRVRHILELTALTQVFQIKY